VRPDSAIVDRLADHLRAAGLAVWIDRNDIPAGQRWKQTIKQAINTGAAFVACFSTNYEARVKSYMNEELTIAIEEIRARPTDRSWFFPVRLDACSVPDRTIGGGESLHDLQTIDFFPDFDEGARRLAAALTDIMTR
jgi:hypothetical protein